jgi:hypothetical protein
MGSPAESEEEVAGRGGEGGEGEHEAVVRRATQL